MSSIHDDLLRIADELSAMDLHGAAQTMVRGAGEIAALREALEPFAFLARYIEARSPQKPDYEIASVTMRNLRSARSALHKEKAQ